MKLHCAKAPSDDVLCTECLVAAILDIAEAAVFEGEMLLLSTEEFLGRQPDERTDALVKDAIPKFAQLRADLEYMKMFVPGLPDDETH